MNSGQVVRADVRELWNLELEDSVYGFTPFCDSNLETEGFRFWKQGYWKNHLRGKPYHIRLEKLLINRKKLSIVHSKIPIECTASTQLVTVASALDCYVAALYLLST